MALFVLAVPAAGEEATLDLRFQRLGPDDGLAQGSAYSLLQDRHGFVWIGTQDGLHRYDGYRFEAYEPDPFRADGLSHGMVENLYEDPDGRIWVGTYRGLDRLAGGGRHFEHPFAESAVDAETVSALVGDGAGGVWVGWLDAGLAHLPRDGEPTFFRADSGESGALPSDHVSALYLDTAGRLFVGFADAPLGTVDLDGFRALPDAVLGRLPASSPAEPVPVRAFVEDAAGRLWIGYRGAGLARVDLDRGEPGRVGTVRRFVHDPADPTSLGGDDVETLLVDRDGRVWVGTLGTGLSVWDPDAERFHSVRHRPADPASLANDTVRALLQDSSGLVWVGTAHGGLTLIDTRPRFGLVRADPDDPASLPANVVRSFLERKDPDGSRSRLFVATDGGGLVIRGSDDASEGFVVPLDLEGRPAVDDERIWDLFEDRDGALWVGAQSALYRLASADITSADIAGADIAAAEDDRFAVEIFRPDPDDPESLGPGGVRALAQDPAGRMWIGHFDGGLSRLDPGARRFERWLPDPDRPYGLPADRVLALLVDRRGHLWIGTTSGLARRTSDGRFHAYRHDADDRSSLLGDIVRTIHQDRVGNLWVGTDAGLNRLPADRVESPPSGGRNEHGFTHFTEADGLPDNMVYAILEEPAGVLWLSTNRGLARFDSGAGTIDTFDLADGLQGWEFNGGAALRAADGTLYFGGVEGYNHFRPGSIGTNEHVPPVRITRVEVLDGPLTPEGFAWDAETLHLDHDEPLVSFEFAALDYTHSRANRYAYRIDGIDRPGTWHDLGHQNVLTLPLDGLDAGEHVLRVRGSNNDGVWNEEGASLRFMVEPSPWLSPAAWIVYSVIGFVLAIFLGSRAHRRRVERRRAEEQIRDSERRLELALLGSGDGLWDWDLVTGDIYRAHVAEMLGYLPDELPPDHDFRRELVHPEDLPRVEETMDEHRRGEKERFEVEYRLRDQWGKWRWILDRGNIVERDADGRPTRIAGTFKDMTAHKETESKLRLWSAVFEAVDEGVMLVDPTGRIRAVNQAFCTMNGRDRDELVGESVRSLASEAHDGEFYRELLRTATEDGEWEGEIEQIRRGPDGEEADRFLVAVDVHAVRDESKRDGRRDAPGANAGPVRHYVVVADDITERKRAEKELRYLADYDVLTDLPNRSCFLRRLDEALDRARERKEEVEASGEGGSSESSETRVALIFGDLDQFKQINDTLGHAVGDLLLQESARRLLGSVREGDLVARLGGDEFTVMLEGVEGRDRVVRVAERILASFDASFDLEGHEVGVSTSLGVALFPDDGEDSETLLKHADTAMYEAKARGRNRYRFYTRELGERALQRLTLDNRLRRALQEDALELYYQPKLDLVAGAVIGAEALIRWPQKDGVVLEPEAFLRVAEETGLIVPLGHWVLDRACAQAAAWIEEGLDLEIAVNLSAAHLGEDDLVESISSALSRAGLAAEFLVLELTEEAIMADVPGRAELLQSLRDLGVRLSIDDFGTGYSSIAHLRRLPIDELKIDRGFVHEAEKDVSVPETILALARGLDLDVVAEGVETREQLEALRAAGCERVQGYLVGRPVPAATLRSHLRSDAPPWRDLVPSPKDRGQGRKKRRGNLRAVD